MSSDQIPDIPTRRAITPPRRAVMLVTTHHTRGTHHAPRVTRRIVVNWRATSTLIVGLALAYLGGVVTASSVLVAVITGGAR
jgi:hypothetical protein